MNKELIMKSDVLDIIFEKRNKAYGAYNLRKFYNNRLAKSLGIMFGAVVILSAFTFLPEKKKPIDPTIYDTRTVAILTEPKKKTELEKPKVTQATQQQPTPQVLAKPIIVDDPVKPITTLTDTSSVVFVNPNPGKPGDGPITVPGPPTTVPGPITTTPEIVKPVVDKTTAIADPEVMPEFPGGMDALRRFLQRNLNNPEDLEQGSMVSVKVQFVVGYDGKLQRFHVIEDGGAPFNNEVIRVLKKMPEWVPGKTNGENVSVYYTIPVKFVPAE